MDNEHHYFATTGYGWSTHSTKEGAIKAAIRYVGSTTLARSKRAGRPGIDATVCRVPLPEKAHYQISGYLPSTIDKEDGVRDARKGELIKLEEIDRVWITTMTGKTIPRSVEE